jgi:hypothetical protein
METISIQYCGAVFTRTSHFSEVGDVLRGHKHFFPHTTVIAHGSVRVTVEGASSQYKAPAMVLIAAHKEHRIDVLEADTVICCVHAIRDGAGLEDIIAENAIPGQVSSAPDSIKVFDFVEFLEGQRLPNRT